MARGLATSKLIYVCVLALGMAALAGAIVVGQQPPAYPPTPALPQGPPPTGQPSLPPNPPLPSPPPDAYQPHPPGPPITPPPGNNQTQPPGPSGSQKCPKIRSMSR